MLVTNKENLIEASKNGYAIPALNTQGGNYDIIWAACRAAEEMKSPIILAHYLPVLIPAMTGLYRSVNGVPTKFLSLYRYT
jgi:hypothetical protein